LLHSIERKRREREMDQRGVMRTSEANNAGSEEMRERIGCESGKERN
jgi:hypothetical protein